MSNEGTEVNIRLPQREEEALEKAILGSYESVTAALVRVDAQRAEARSQNDKAMIFEAIETWVGGFGAVNQAVKDQLREWCLNKAIAAVKGMQRRGEDGSVSYAGLCNQVGLVLRGFGDTDRAISYYERALAICLKTEGDTDENVATLYSNLGTAYRGKGEDDKAIAYHEKAREILVDTLGEQHPSTAATYNNLGSACYSKGAYDKAIKCNEKAREIRVETLGESNPSTATSLYNIGLLHKDPGDEEQKAIAYIQRAAAALKESAAVTASK